MMISLNIPGQPVAKGRPRFARRGKFVSTYTPKKTVDYESHVIACAIEAMQGRLPSKAPIEIQVVLSFEIPANWPKKKRQEAIDGVIMATKKPDADNCLKVIQDGCNKICWEDDSQIVSTILYKEYSEYPMARVVIRELEGKCA